jgi:hypothetical protein
MARSVSGPFRIAVNAPLVGAQAFAARRSQPGVVRWVGVDSPDDLGTVNLTRANYPGPVKDYEDADELRYDGRDVDAAPSQPRVFEDVVQFLAED